MPTNSHRPRPIRPKASRPFLAVQDLRSWPANVRRCLHLAATRNEQLAPSFVTSLDLVPSTKEFEALRLWEDSPTSSTYDQAQGSDSSQSSSRSPDRGSGANLWASHTSVQRQERCKWLVLLLNRCAWGSRRRWR